MFKDCATLRKTQLPSLLASFLKFALPAVICLNSIGSQAQFMIDEPEIRSRAASELSYSMDRGSLKEWAAQQEITGTYLFEITLRGKGQVASVRVVERINGSIDHQNRLKDHLMDYKFDIPVHKKQIVRMEYQFEF